MADMPEPVSLNPCPSLLDEEDDEPDENDDEENSKDRIPMMNWNPQELLQRHRDLTLRLAQIRSQRRQISQYRRQFDAIQQELYHRWNTTQHRHDENLQRIVSTELEITNLQNQYQNLQSWNLLSNDAFHIDCEQQTATINSLRLGINTIHNNNKTQPVQASVAPSSASNFFSWTSATNTTATTTTPSSSLPWKIPWREINAAFGHVALLLVVLTEQLFDPNTVAPFRYQILPMGSTSKIGSVIHPKQQSPQTPSTFYNLFYSEEGFPFFAKRRFLTAMQYLVEHVHEIAQYMIAQDRSILLPHIMETTTNQSSSSSVSKIGGLSVSIVTTTFPDADNIAEWTRVIKYLVTDIKYLLTFRGLGMLRPPSPPPPPKTK